MTTPIPPTPTTSTHAAAPATRPGRRPRSWPVLLLALPAFVAVWSGWVGLGGLTGFGVIHPLPGTPLAGWTLDTAITLPIGVETYAAYALHVWLTGDPTRRAARFAKWSAIGSLLLGAAGQVAYHLMTAAHGPQAPMVITALVACLPVAVLGMGAALAHLVHDAQPEPAPSSPTTAATPAPAPSGSSPTTHPAPDTHADTDTAPDTGTTVRRPRTRTPRTAQPARGASDTARRAARLKARRPDLTQAQIAAELGITERTLRRHLNPPTPSTTVTPAADDESTARAA